MAKNRQFTDRKESEKIMKLLRRDFTVVSKQQGKAGDPDFIPGYGIYKKDCSDKTIHKKVFPNNHVGISAVQGHRRDYFGNLNIAGTTAYVPPAAAAKPSPELPPVNTAPAILEPPPATDLNWRVHELGRAVADLAAAGQLMNQERIRQRKWDLALIDTQAKQIQQLELRVIELEGAYTAPKPQLGLVAR